jgi:RNA polymerase sigma factor (sigma-70 family)
MHPHSRACPRPRPPIDTASGLATGSAVELPLPLRRLVAAECSAEAPAAGVETEDLQQAVWLRWLEQVRTRGDTSTAPPSAGWLRSAVRAEARRARRRTRREVPLPADVIDTDGADPATSQLAEATLLAAEQRRVLADAVSRLPGRCPALMRAMLSRQDLTYPEIARELGMSQGSIGPVRSRCLGCLRTMLKASDCRT